MFICCLFVVLLMLGFRSDATAARPSIDIASGAHVRLAYSVAATDRSL